jgi:hypothetical protein
MAIVLCEAVKKRQVEREKVVSTAAKKARRTELEMLQNMGGVGVMGELRQICDTLLNIAQKYMPHSPMAFADADSVAQCAHALGRMALQPKLAPRFKAAAESMDPNCVFNSFDYRYLRNKAIAGFATIADLPAKPSAVGTLD